jgi:tRNA(fMet)-specific endonuclease VapC
VIRSRYMLDTDTVSHLVRQHPNVARRVLSMPMASLCTSAITVSELLSGLAKRPDAVRLQAAVTEPMRRVDVLQWDISAAKRYGILRAARTVRADCSDGLTCSSRRTPWPSVRC